MVAVCSFASSALISALCATRGLPGERGAWRDHRRCDRAAVGGRIEGDGDLTAAGSGSGQRHTGRAGRHERRAATAAAFGPATAATA